ncbi:MAG: ATP-binding protein [Paludibacteraceae bacterium]|nr:ATP-binding protein [Paludibacteraceae bacterium]
MVFERKSYLQQLIDSRGNGIVKIVTGIRRCGKSYLLCNLFHAWLIKYGVAEDHIIQLGLDTRKNKALLNPDKLIEFVEGKIVNDGAITYVILDEIQLVDDFVGVILSFMQMPNVDVYVSGSNSKFLSSEVATEFRGRGKEIRVHPLSFAEYFEAVGGDRDKALDIYYKYGGLPQVAQMDDEREKREYLLNIYETVYLRDVIDRNHLRNPEGLRQLIQVLASNISCSSNPQRISKTFKSERGLTIAPRTIDSYLRFLQDAFIVSEAQRYDVKGRKYIGSESKYFFEDIGLRNAILNFRQIEDTHIMENVIYNELRVRRYSVDVGMVEIWRTKEDGDKERIKLEIDFVVNIIPEKVYIQSALTLSSIEKKNQELRSLLNVQDNFQKMVVVANGLISAVNEEGIQIKTLFDFLLNPDSVI